MDLQPSLDHALDDGELLLQFESIGDNCELGLVQRRVGVEPLGLLRFAGAPLRHLLRALHARFAGIAEPHHVRLQPENGEYMVKLTKYDFTHHTHVQIGAMEPVALHRQQCRTIGFLAGKLVGDLEAPSKILVFRQNEPLSAADLVDLRIALSVYGPSVLLWVQEARPGHPPGTVDVADERLLVGYVRRLADRDDVPDLDMESWLAMLRNAHGLWRRAQAGGVALGDFAAGQLARTELTFGQEGNAACHLGYGWSGPEAGYTWSIGERSLLTIENPADADTYWLEMDVMPFVSPPLLPRQRLDVVIGGTLVHSFDPLARGEVGCLVPGHLIAGRTEVAIILDHPYAASPVLVAGGQDDRRLGVAFTRIALICT
ncbi:hypothetical protein [Rhodopila sp.]|uniref:hypothetical protein n=1 Tax=Rhodopila sp. TaxID=2480087 RepID=UPI003D0A6941